MADAAPRMALGTVQWGMSYGIGNATGPPSDTELARMLRAASELGIDTLDTARAYGDAEWRIGATFQALGSSDRFRVITKVAPDIFHAGREGELKAAQQRLSDSVAASAEALAPTRIDTLLLHRSDQRTAAGGALWDVMQRLRARGLVARIGASALSPADALDALEDASVEVMQVPASLLDQRLARAGFFQTARDRGVEVHVRSVYLQGAAFLAPDRLPTHLTASRPLIEEIHTYARRVGREVMDVWLDYARTLPVDHLVIGTESLVQLRRNADRFTQPCLDSISCFAADLPLLGDEILDPARWPR